MLERFCGVREEECELRGRLLVAVCQALWELLASRDADEWHGVCLPSLLGHVDLVAAEKSRVREDGVVVV